MPRLSCRIVVRRLSVPILAGILTVAGCAPQSAPVTTATFPVDPGPGVTPPAGAVEVSELNVLDGDSLEALADGETIEVRLLGVNAAERGECWSEEARSALEELLDTGQVWLQPAGGTDRFGRILGYLFAADVLVNVALIEGGHAVAVDIDHPERAEFLASEEAAFRAGRGWWAAGACGPGGGTSVVIAAVEFDAPGPDEENLDGEWVRLVNDGADADLGGWTLRDESSSHRFRFPTGAGLESGEAVVVRTGCGPDGRSEYHWCSDGPVWSNGGDTVLLLDDLGNVVDRYRYEG